MRINMLPFFARRLLLGSLVGIFILGAAQARVAADNDTAGGITAGESGISGFRGTQEIRTNPPSPSGDTTWAHPFQIHLPGSAFLAVGTYKGARVGNTGCLANHGDWNSYIDGETPMGDYFCIRKQIHAFSKGSTPELELFRFVCPSTGILGWAVKINGTRRACKDMFGAAATGGAVALEVATPAGVTPNGANIDVIHRNLMFLNGPTGAWSAMDPNATNSRPVFYTVGIPNNFRVNSRFGAMD